MSKENETKEPELNLETAFNNLVGVAREMKLSHKEHVILERSVQMVLESLRSALEQDEAQSKTKTAEAPSLPSDTSKRKKKGVKN